PARRAHLLPAECRCLGRLRLGGPEHRCQCPPSQGCFSSRTRSIRAGLCPPLLEECIGGYFFRCRKTRLGNQSSHAGHLCKGGRLLARNHRSRRASSLGGSRGRHPIPALFGGLRNNEAFEKNKKLARSL
ncbi:uncharacterized protein METZ01_LOCUS283400, partial [marine metagenome]